MIYFPPPKYYLTDQSAKKNLTASESAAFQFRSLEPADGMALHQLVKDCSPLDTNSAYCNLLQCSHFQTTSIAAVSEGRLVGSVTGYRIPDRLDTLFVWQVAVHPTVRGQGLARTMLQKLLAKKTLQDIRYIETSITPENEASTRLFAGLAKNRDAKMTRSVLFDKTIHFQDVHDTEYLFQIGPL